MSKAEDTARAFGDMCSCGFKRYIILRGVFKWRWCTRCDGNQMPEAILEDEADE